ncbi:MAG: ferrochelatase [Acidimicrobiales bacterium]
MSPPVGVVAMAYGTPASPDDVEAYYTRVRGGRPPPPEVLDDLRRRYRAIGGVSPLARRSRAQAAGLQAALDGMEPGRFTVRLGYKHAPPFIEDAVDAVIAAGARHLVALVLAPHYAAASVGQYLDRARRRAAHGGGDVAVTGIESWHLEPAYLDFLVAQVRAARSRLPAASKVLFTAHSLPRRAVRDDPYPGQVRETGAAVATRVGLDPCPGWAVAWQSAGRTPEPWLGPDLGHVIRRLGATGRATGVLVCPCGFVSDHLEVLYDLDVEARRVAGEVGLAWARTAMPNDDATVLGALALRVGRAVAAIPAR